MNAVTRRDRIRYTGHDPISGPPIGPRAAAAFCVLLGGSGGLLVLAGLRVASFGSAPIAAGREAMVVAAGLSFLLIGVYLGTHAALRSRRERRRHVLAERYPFEPWLWDHRWSRDGIGDTAVREAVAGTGRVLFLALFLAIFHGLLAEEGSFELMTGLPFVTLADGRTAPGPGFWIVGLSLLVFDVVLAWACVDAVTRTVRLARHGCGHVRFESFPFLLGEEARLALILPFPRGSLRSVRVALRFVEEELVTTDERGSDESRMVAYQLFADERTIDDEEVLARAETGLRLVFPLPADLPPTNLSSQPRSFWQLDVVAVAPGGDYVGRFLLPVYSTSARTGRTAPRRGSERSDRGAERAHASP